MFVRFAVDNRLSSTGFLAKIQYGNEILNQKLVSIGYKVTVYTSCYKYSNAGMRNAVSPKSHFNHIFCQI